MSENKLDQIRNYLEVAIKLLGELKITQVIDKEFLTNAEAAEMMGVKKESFNNSRSAKKIILRNYGSAQRALFKRTDVEELLK